MLYLHTCIYIHEKTYLVGPVKLSDPWTVLFQTQLLALTGREYIHVHVHLHERYALTNVHVFVYRYSACEHVMECECIFMYCKGVH